MKTRTRSLLAVVMVFGALGVLAPGNVTLNPWLLCVPMFLPSFSAAKVILGSLSLLMLVLAYILRRSYHGAWWPLVCAFGLFALGAAITLLPFSFRWRLGVARDWGWDLFYPALPLLCLTFNVVSLILLLTDRPPWVGEAATPTPDPCDSSGGTGQDRSE